MVVSTKKKVRMDMSNEYFDLEGASMSDFQFNLHPDSKFTRWWLSEEEGSSWRIIHEEENRLVGRGSSLQLVEPQMMDVQFSYSNLWELLSPVPIGDSAKHRLVGFLLSLAHSLLELGRGGCHKLWKITLRLDIYQNCFLEKKDMEYYNRWAAELEEECCCSICLDDMEKGSTVTRLPCSHVFHGDCIFKWLRDSSSTCPLCRFQVPLIPS